MLTIYLYIEMNDKYEDDPHRDDCDTASQYSHSLSPSLGSTESLARCQPVHMTSSPLLRILIMEGGIVAAHNGDSLRRVGVAVCT